MNNLSILHFLSYAFIQRAYLAGIFIAVLCAVLGLFLILRRLSLIGDGLSHVSFGAIALGLFFGVYPFYVAIPVVLIASYFIQRLAEKSKVYGDTAIGIVSAVGISGGVILASLARGFNVDLFSYLFGNILAISTFEVYLSLIMSLLVLAVVILLYNELFASSFDSEYAKITGIKTGALSVVFTCLTAVAVVLASKVVGVMLVSALLIIPAAAALQLSRSFKEAMILAAVMAGLAVIIGISVSFFLDLPAGAVVVLTSFVLFIIALFFRRA